MKKRSDAEIARTRAFWLANRPGETVAPAVAPDPPLGWLVALALGGALVLQSSFAPVLAFRGATPSFVTLVVLWYAMRTGAVRGLAFGLLAGTCEDAFSGGTGVAWMFATGLVGAFAGRIRGTWFADTKLVLVPGAALLTLVRVALFSVVMAMSGRPIPLGPALVHVALWQSALDAVLAYLALARFPNLGGIAAYRR